MKAVIFVLMYLSTVKRRLVCEKTLTASNQQVKHMNTIEVHVNGVLVESVDPNGRQLSHSFKHKSCSKE